MLGMIGLENMYGYEMHEQVTRIPDNAEYCGTAEKNGRTYDCFLVPNGVSYKAICIYMY